MESTISRTALPMTVGFFICICKRSSLNTVVEFNLRLCSGRTNAYPCIICQFIVQNVGVRKSCRFHCACCHICDRVCLVISYSNYFVSCKFCRRILTQGIHDLLDLLKSFDSLHGYRLDRIFVITKLFIHLDHCIPQSLALRLVVCCCFAKCHCRNDCILVSCICTDQAAIALFKSKEIGSFSALFKSEDLLSDKLESCQDLDQFYTVPLGDCICKVCGNNCLDQCTVLRKASVYGFAAG